MNKLWRRETIAAGKGDGTDGKDNEIEDNRTYFCSELIAKGFKLAGVLKNDNVASAQFFPGDFAEGGQEFLEQKLEQNATIHRELEIELN